MALNSWGVEADQGEGLPGTPQETYQGEKTSTAPVSTAGV